MMNFKYVAIAVIAVLLSACGEEDVQAPKVIDIDTPELFTGGEGIEGPVSATLDARLKLEDIPVVDKALYSHEAAQVIGLVQYETSKASKAKIKSFLKDAMDGQGDFTFDNSGTFGAFKYKAQGLNIPSGNLTDYEVLAIFVKNEDGISMLYDYGIRWQCKNGGFDWTITPCE